MPSVTGICEAGGARGMKTTITLESGEALKLDVPNNIRFSDLPILLVKILVFLRVACASNASACTEELL